MSTDRAPVITVKNLKYAAFASEETHCFEATVYVDGKKFCRTSNEGHGGCNMDYPVGKATMGDLGRRIVELNKRIAATAEPPLESEPEWKQDLWKKGFRPNFETAVMEAVERELAAKDLKKILKKSVMIEDEGRCYTLDPMPVDALFGLHRVAAKESIAKAYPKAKIINLLPFEEALGIYMKAT